MCQLCSPFKFSRRIQGLVNRVLIDANCKGKTLQFLAENVGITASTIFPDVVGLGRYLRWQFDSFAP